MLEKVENVPAGIDAMKAFGKVSREDYEAVVVPLVDDAAREGRHIRVLCQLGPEFEGLTPGGAWEDVKIAPRGLRVLDGCAIVSDISWIRESTRLAAFLLPCPVQVFGNQDRDKAVEWLGSLPEGAGISHRLVPESGIVVVEIAQPLRAQDFDALARTVDSWLDTNAVLNGLVIHARAFPGWENIRSLVRHVRFVRDHHRQIKKIAVAVDGKLAALAPNVAKHFVHPEIRTFGYDKLEAATSWAAAPTTRR